MNRRIQKVTVACILGLMPVASRGQQAVVQPVSVVGHVKVLSDKVPDVSSMEAWKRTFIRDGMSDREKALAAFKTKVMFAYQRLEARHRTNVAVTIPFR